MKLAALLNNRFTEVETRKKIVKLKKADEAYKKNANYFTPVTNPAMEELVDLLTGKKEKQENNDLDQFIQKLKNERPVEPEITMADELSADELLSNIIDDSAVKPVETILNEEASAQLLSETSSNERQTIQLNEERRMSRKRLTEKAIATYKYQMSMTKNGFEILQPMIYRTA